MFSLLSAQYLANIPQAMSHVVGGDFRLVQLAHRKREGERDSKEKKKDVERDVRIMMRARSRGWVKVDTKGVTLIEIEGEMRSCVEKG